MKQHLKTTLERRGAAGASVDKIKGFGTKQHLKTTLENNTWNQHLKTTLENNT